MSHRATWIDSCIASTYSDLWCFSFKITSTVLLLEFAMLVLYGVTRSQQMFIDIGIGVILLWCVLNVARRALK
jgi:hypothetical protein